MKEGRKEKDPDVKPTVGFTLPRVGGKEKMRRYAPVRTLSEEIGDRQFSDSPAVCLSNGEFKWVR